MRPLKGRIRYLGTGQTTDDMIFKFVSVRGAAEWLKAEINSDDRTSDDSAGTVKWVLGRIDKAFEDVTKK